MPKKFPCLYKIIKNDDISVLTDFFVENPGYNEQNTLSVGAGLTLLSQAIKSNSIQCCFFLINRLDLTILDDYVVTVINSYKNKPEIFDHFYTIVKMHCQQRNNFEVINNIIIHLINTNQKIPEELMTKIINEYDFQAQLQNTNFKRNLEATIIRNKYSWFVYFEKYYREHNINRNDFFVNALIFSGQDTNKILKIFKNMDYTEKVKVKKTIPYEQIIIQSKHKYSLEFIISITCDIKDLSKLTIFKENMFENELFNLFSECEDIESIRAFGYGTNNMFNEFMQNINKKNISYYTYHLIKPEYHDRLIKMIPYVTIRFIEFMRKYLSFEEFNLEDYKKNNYYYSAKPEYIENSRSLLKKLIDEFDKVHNNN